LSTNRLSSPFLASTLQQFFASVALGTRILADARDDIFRIELRSRCARLLLCKGRSISPADLVGEWIS
jgi:hypothetical protein